ncbi:MAG: YicC family protein [Candidatus Glassbacteria bacterium]|nr:YicC family protein [Candidatus Glassbacteria bacterium]
MLTSMTGFGRAEANFEKGTFTVEIRSVNHRYADFSIRVPRVLSGLQDRIKELIKTRISRGYITYQLSWEQTGEGVETLSVNAEIIKRYQELFSRMKSDFGIQGEPTVDTFSRLSDIFTRESPDEDEDRLWSVAEQATNEALDRLLAMRRREGQALAVDIVERLDSMADHMKQAGLHEPDRLQKLESRLREKVIAAMGEDAVDENRLLAEITIYADKWDFSEEEVRFRSHLGAFRAGLEKGGAIGRKLHFLLQELNREVNTVASKANDAEIAQHMVACKEEIEKIREQVENIE